MSIVLIDCGSSNLKSVQKAFHSLNLLTPITQNSHEIINATGVVLPGVGSFDAVMQEIRNKNLEEPILQAIASGKPFLGICVGLQILFNESEEGNEKGLGALEGKVEKFKLNQPAFSNFKIPHMGWNRLIVKKQNPLLEGIQSGDMFYFVHSYYPVPNKNEIVATSTDYGTEFTSSIAKDNVYGTQFHPEKSGDKGLLILKNFIKICTKRG